MPAEPRSTGRRGVTLAVTCLATFVAILDTTVVNVALHAIQRDLRAGVSTLQWVLDGYNLTYAAFILAGGAVGDLFGRRRVFLVGMGLFVLGSVACAAAPGAGVLIAGRVVAGLGAALQLPGALALLAVAFPEGRDRSRAIAIWGGFNGLAMGVGPTVGGLLVDHLGWRSIFWLVVPFGLVVLALARAGVAESSDPAGRRLDAPGQLSSVAALALLTFALIGAPERGWGSPLVISSLALAALAAAAFLAAERGRDDALLPLHLLRHRGFSVAVGSAAVMTFAFYGFLFLFPLYLQQVRGHSAVTAGLLLLPMSLTFFVLSPLAGRLLPAVGPGALVGGGLTLMGAGVLALSWSGTRTGAAQMVVPLIAMGLGMAMATGPVMTLAVSSLPSARAGTSSGMVNVGRMVGATMGVAVAGSLFGGGVLQASGDAARFTRGMHRALLVGGAVEVLGGLVAPLVLARARRRQPGRLRALRFRGART